MGNDEERKYREYMKSDKWRSIAKQRMEIDNYTCVGCGCKGTTNNPLEVHHLSYKNLYHEEDRIYEDLVSVCHSCHKNLHRIMERKTNAAGRRGWKDNPRIPQTHIYNISGQIGIKEDHTE